MLFMNEGEIEQALSLARNPVMAAATKLLSDLRHVTNQNSDGWHSWPKPCRAAEKLQTLIQEYRYDQDKLTWVMLKKAVTPIKTFYTRYKSQLTRGEPLAFPC